VESYSSQEQLGLAWLLDMMLLDEYDEIGGSVFMHAMVDFCFSEKKPAQHCKPSIFIVNSPIVFQELGNLKRC